MAVTPTPTVTLGGTVAAGLLLARDTTTPPWGAGPVRLAIPVAGWPPVRLPGLTDKEVNVIGAGVGVGVGGGGGGAVPGW